MRIFHPLRRAPVLLLWAGLSLSALGDQLYAVALTWVAVDVFGSGAGYLAAVQAFVALVAVLGIGGWADRWDQLRGMIGADLSRAVVLLGVVGVWEASGGPGGVPLTVAIVVLAVANAVFQPAMQALLPSLVGDARLLASANGLLDATNRSARLLGPGMVALLAGILPVVHFFTLDAVSFVASALALGLIGRLRPDLPRAPVAGVREPMWFGMARGWQAMRAHPLLGYVLATAGPIYGVWYAVLFLGVPLLLDHHGSGLTSYGTVLSAYGCTNLAATLFYGGREVPDRPQFQMFGGTVLTGAGLGLMGVAGWLPDPMFLPALAGAAALSAIGGPMRDIPLAVMRQTRLRPADVPAGMRAYMAASGAGLLVVMLLAPVAVTLGGTVAVILACGAVYLAIGVVGLVRFAGWTESGHSISDLVTKAG